MSGQLLLSMTLLGLFSCGSQVVAPVQEAPVPSWSQWRGPLGTGSSPDAAPPTRWSETENIAWKCALPGLGHSSPVVWGDRVFVTTAIPYGEHLPPVPDDAPGAHDNAPVTQRHEFAALAVDRNSGEVLWKTVLYKGLPHAGAHNSGSLASNSPCVDGSRLYVSFGSVGLFCLSHSGELLWQTNLGDMQVKHGHGEGSSPALYEDSLIINWDHEGESFVVALDAASGDERWKNPRDEVTSWSSPIVSEVDGVPQVIVSGTQRIRAYDLQDGALIWECGGLSNNVVASPVAGQGVLVAGSSYEKRAMVAIELAGAQGDLTGTDKVIWSRSHRTPYVPSPLIHGHSVYFLTHYQGVLSRIELKTGNEPSRPLRLEWLYEIYSSPVAAADKVYITDRAGTTVVLDHKSEPATVIAVNKLEDEFSASAALVGGDLILRGAVYLYCVREDPSKQAE